MNETPENTNSSAGSLERMVRRLGLQKVLNWGKRGLIDNLNDWCWRWRIARSKILKLQLKFSNALLKRRILRLERGVVLLGGSQFFGVVSHDINDGLSPNAGTQRPGNSDSDVETRSPKPGSLE